MSEKAKCPLCGQEYEGRPALSRADNQTLICPDCGTRQALDELGIANPEAVIKRIHEYDAAHKAEQGGEPDA